MGKGLRIGVGSGVPADQRKWESARARSGHGRRKAENVGLGRKSGQGGTGSGWCTYVRGAKVTSCG